MVNWAPLTVPLERRLQTAAVVLILSVLPTFLAIWTWGVFFTSSNLIRTAFVLYTLIIWFVDRAPVRGGREDMWVRRWAIWRTFRDYFPTRLHVTEKLDPKKLYVIGIHPHGIIGMSLWTTLFTEANDVTKRLGISFRSATVTASFKIPFWRDLILGVGGVSASRHSVEHVLAKDRTSIAIVVGGALEALDAFPGNVNLTLRRRKGFVRIALQHGADLVPVYSFGENELYSQLSDGSPDNAFRRLQLWLIRTVGFCLPLPRGRGIFQYDLGFLPHRRPCNTVVGAPIPLPKLKPEPGCSTVSVPEALVDEYHAKYCDALVALYERHKAEFMEEKYRHLTLRIVH